MKVNRYKVTLPKSASHKKINVLTTATSEQQAIDQVTEAFAKYAPPSYIAKIVCINVDASEYLASIKPKRIKKGVVL